MSRTFYEDQIQHRPPNEVVRHDALVLSIKYSVHKYYSGAAHGNGQTVAWNYWRNPLFLVRLQQLFSSLNYLEELSALSGSALLDDRQRDRDWVFRGTEPETENFRYFNIAPSGLLLTFDAYQVVLLCGRATSRGDTAERFGWYSPPAILLVVVTANNRIEFARGARPTRKSPRLLLAAHAGRYTKGLCYAAPRLRSGSPSHRANDGTRVAASTASPPSASPSPAPASTWLG